eukprot:scaffold57386_cov19-Tisochrysis_lutea.AAC.2
MCVQPGLGKTTPSEACAGPRFRLNPQGNTPLAVLPIHTLVLAFARTNCPAREHQTDLSPPSAAARLLNTRLKLPGGLT